MYIECPDLTNDKKVSINTAINGSVFTFVFKWNEFCDCCFLDIYDNNNDRLYCGNALTTNSSIFTKKKVLPNLVFLHKDGSSFEPTPETMKDFILHYEDSTEQ